ncbi:hypothetical protein WOLCODRAFT_152920 [Wolfiporia cocos MD-104 SS10]|uniref:Uncharacterized protein n=1 Tax=Wolfiporia cocos (strain MD-104) TaxID=742152 RepID=A0A2H3JSI3_WOLCO|nr:hypothetical protein WOLCODRAFT_152920 [Wolfiporia cocos MD-104 SS10]
MGSAGVFGVCVVLEYPLMQTRPVLRRARAPHDASDDCHVAVPAAPLLLVVVREHGRGPDGGEDTTRAAPFTPGMQRGGREAENLRCFLASHHTAAGSASPVPGFLLRPASSLHLPGSPFRVPAAPRAVRAARSSLATDRTEQRPAPRSAVPTAHAAGSGRLGPRTAHRARGNARSPTSGPRPRMPSGHPSAAPEDRSAPRCTMQSRASPMALPCRMIAS